VWSVECGVWSVECGGLRNEGSLLGVEGREFECSVLGCDVYGSDFRAQGFDGQISVDGQIGLEVHVRSSTMSPMMYVKAAILVDTMVACVTWRETSFDRIHFIIVMIGWTGLAPWEFEFPFSR